MADIAHPAGLIATGLLNNAVNHCHIVTSTTHKTLRGPRGGIILMGKDFENPFGKKNAKGEVLMMSALLDASVFPGMQGGPLEHIIAAKAIAFQEALQPNYTDYCKRIIANTQALAEALKDRNYRLISGGTDNHSILIDISGKNITGKDADIALGKAHITVNKNMIPFDVLSPFITSGIRIGAAAITTRGLNVQDMPQIVEWMDEVILHPNDDLKIKRVGEKVKKFMGGFGLFQG